MDDDKGDGDGNQAAPVTEDTVALRFVVIDRDGDTVHLLCEGEGELFGCPTIGADTWAAALTQVPDAWEIVDLTGGTQPGRRRRRRCRPRTLPDDGERSG